MVRAVLRVIAGLCLGAMLGWLLNDFPQIDEPAFFVVNVDGPFSHEQMEQFQQEGNKLAMKKAEEIRKSKQDFNISVMNLIFIATIFGMLAGLSLLLDLKALGLQMHRVNEVGYPSTM
jgi:hypothetical protein